MIKTIPECWHCNEDVYPDHNGEYLKIGEYVVCGRDECIEAAGLELGLNEKYKPLNDDYSFADFVIDEKAEWERII